MLYLPTEEELRIELERERWLIERKQVDATSTVEKNAIIQKRKGGKHGKQ